MQTSDIVALREELKERDALRHKRYDLNMAAIGGSYDSRRMDGYWELWESITGKSIPNDREEYEFRINLIPNIIKTVRSAPADYAVEPEITVPPLVKDVVAPGAVTPANTYDHAFYRIQHELSHGVHRALGSRLVTFTVDFFQNMSASIVQAAGGRNRFMMQPMQSTNNVGGNPRAGYMQMMYDIPDGEALVVEAEIPE